MLFRLLVPLMVAVLLLASPGLQQIRAASASASTPAWAAPASSALKRVGGADSTQRQPVYLSNLDCTSLTYRLVGSSTMRTGCFTPTAFGMLDSDYKLVLFNGTDEVTPLTPYSPHQILAPWPNALNLLTLDPLDTGGALVRMYKNPLAAMQDKRNSLGQLTGKRLATAPETNLLAPDGRQLVVHGQSLAFSTRGSWLVAETIYGYFVRINLSSLQALPFGPVFSGSNSSEPPDAQVAISANGRFVAVENSSNTTFKVYDLATCSGNAVSWQAEACQSHDYWPFASQHISGLRGVSHLRFMDEGLLSFETTGSDAAGASTYELAPTSSIDHLVDYLGLGDSYTSGEGAFDYLSGTDTSDNTCHLSSHSYPLLLARDVFGGSSGHSVACSGAVINDLGSNNSGYKGQVQQGSSLENWESDQTGQLQSLLVNYSPGYVPQHMFVQHYQPRVVTVSVGGNDIGFGDILQRCVVPRISQYTSNQTCYNTYEDRMELVNLVNRTIPRWTSLYKELRADSPDSAIYAVGYPSIAADTGDCPLNVNLGKSELEFAEELIHYLDGAMQQAAAAAGVRYVDVSQALNGHRLCETNGNGVAVNGLTAGNDFGVFGVGLLGRESYHPNALGHELLEQSILRQTNNFTEVGGSAANTNDSTTLLNAPKSGRAVNAVVPAHMVNDPLVKPGSSVTVNVDGAACGLEPGGSYTVRLDGSTGPILGSLGGAITMPAGTPPGIHTIDVTGSNQAGEPVDITQPIYVPGNDSGVPAEQTINVLLNSIGGRDLLPRRNY